MRICISASAALLCLTAAPPQSAGAFSTGHHSSSGVAALFSSSPATLTSMGSNSRLLSSASTNAEDVEISTSSAAAALDQAKLASTNLFGDEGVDVLEFELKHHKPLGCTAEVIIRPNKTLNKISKYIIFSKNCFIILYHSASAKLE